MITFKQLAHVQSLARYRNFRQAAEALWLSQPALTRSLQALERTLGVTLFDRLPGGLEPTVFGQILLEKARVILRERDDLTRELALLQGLNVGTITLSAAPYPNELLVPGTIARMMAEHPGLHCRLRSGDWREVASHVLTRQSDLGIAEISEAAQDERLVAEPVGQPRLFFYCRARHPLKRKRRITLTDLMAFPWVSTKAPPRMAALFSGDTSRAGAIDPSSGDFLPAVKVETPGAAKSIVAATDLLSAGTLTQIEQELESGAFAVLSYHAEWLHLNYGFIYLRHRTPAPAARLFTETFRRLEAELKVHEEALRTRFAAGF